VAGTVGTLGVAWMKMRQAAESARAVKAAEEAEKTRLLSQHLVAAMSDMRAATSAISSCVWVSAEKVAQLISCSDEIRSLLKDQVGMTRVDDRVVEDVYRELERIAAMLGECKQCQAMSPAQREQIVHGLEKIVGRDAMERMMSRVLRGKQGD
jgi:hypothetical protein